MKKPEIARSIARQSKTSVPLAADSLDRMIHELVQRMRQGKEARLPGVGRFTYAADGTIDFEREGGNRRG